MAHYSRFLCEDALSEENAIELWHLAAKLRNQVQWISECIFTTPVLITLTYPFYCSLGCRGIHKGILDTALCSDSKVWGLWTQFLLWPAKRFATLLCQLHQYAGLSSLSWKPEEEAGSQPFVPGSSEQQLSNSLTWIVKYPLEQNNPRATTGAIAVWKSNGIICDE